MAALNKVQVIGNLGKDPEVKTAGSSQVANFSVAVTSKWNDRNGQQQTKTEWIPCVAWGRLADIAGQYLRKGSQVYVEGEYTTRKWQDQNGNDRYTTEVKVWQMQMLGNKQQQGEGSSAGAQQQNGGYQPHTGAGPAPAPSDDLPF